MWIGLGAVLAADGAAAQEWRYRVRPGDTVWDLAGKYMRDDVPWQRLQAHNEIVDPYRLRPGSQIRFPVPWLKQQPAKARVVGVTGEAYASHPRSGRQSIAEGAELGIGTRLTTATDANLTLQFADGSRLLLQGDSELVLDKLSAYGATGMVDTRLRLQRGRTGNAVEPLRGPASRFIIETPNTVSSVRGTRFRVGSDGARSHAEVLEGRVEVVGDGRQHLLRPGQGTVSDAGTGPSAPRKLLPAPDRASVTLDSRQLPARLSWAPVAGAQRYRIQVARSPEFVTLLHDRLSSAPDAPLAGLPNATYHFRIRAVDADGVEGRDVVVKDDIRVPPPFTIAPVDGSRVESDRPRFRWASMGDDVRYRFQLADAGGFTTPLIDDAELSKTDIRVRRTLPPGDYLWRVAAIDSDGRATAFSDSVRFSLSAPTPGPEVERDPAAGDDVLHLRWPAGTDDQRFRFQLSRTPDFSRLEVDREVDSNEIALPDLKSGTWYARIQTLESDGYAGEFGPAQRIKLGCRLCRWFAAGGVIVLLLSL